VQNEDLIAIRSRQVSRAARLAIPLAAVVLLVVSAQSAKSAAAPATTIPASSASTPPQTEMASLINSAALPELGQPGFSKYQQQVSEFYQKGGYAPVWIRDGRPTPQGSAMIAQFKDAQLKGLHPEDYDATRWDERVAGLAAATPPPSSSDQVHFDLALTICAMRFISDLHVGRVNPQHFKFGLDVGTKQYDLADVLRNQIIDAPDVPAAIAKVEPPYDGYRRLEAALPEYMKLAAQRDVPRVPIPDRSVHPGKAYAGLSQLVARLRQLGDLASAQEVSTDSGIYGGPIVDAVKHFQQRHGLATDGTLGAGTVAELNKPLSYRLQQLNFALERYRWIPRRFPEPPIVVNIPEFLLRTLRRQPAEFLTMKVVVGRAYRTQTPVFADEMRYVIFRPYWNVPTSILRHEMIPKIQRNPNYLAQNRYEVTDSGGSVITDGVVTADVMGGLRSGAYSVRQKPGPKNALGLVKFIFPNNYNVYLHSTPETQLFSRARRDFSHGCIRVENPTGLAVWVLRNNQGWDLDRIRATMNGDIDNIQVNLEQPIPVLILYTTAVVEPDSEVRFFDDIYGYDTALEKALALPES
jgi:murein L,D-transpeptidase YcbB/YkuD